MALIGNETVVRNGLVIIGVEEYNTNPEIYLSLDADGKLIYRTGVSVLADITEDLTEGYVPVKSSDTLIDSIIYLSDGKMGVNVTNPDGTLHVMTASAGVVTAHSSGDDFVIENNEDGGITVLTPNDNIGGVFFGSPTSNKGAGMSWKYADRILKIGTLVANGITHIISGAGTVGITLSQTQVVAFNGAGYQYAGVIVSGATGELSVKQYGADATKYLNNLGNWTTPNLTLSNYYLTISAYKSVGATTWGNIDFELPAEIEQNTNNEYNAVTSTFKIFSGDTWKFDLTVSLLATEAAQYIELQIYNTTNNRVISSAIIVPNGITYQQTISLSGMVYADGDKGIVFRAYSNYRFEFRHDSVNESLLGTTLVATKRN